MLDAGFRIDDDGSDDEAQKTWQAMIDAALKE
jgi:hypothetical protein